MRRYWILLAISLLGIAGCSKREEANRLPSPANRPPLSPMASYNQQQQYQPSPQQYRSPSPPPQPRPRRIRRQDAYPQSSQVQVPDLQQQMYAQQAAQQAQYRRTLGEKNLKRFAEHYPALGVQIGKMNELLAQAGNNVYLRQSPEWQSMFAEVSRNLSEETTELSASVSGMMRENTASSAGNVNTGMYLASVHRECINLGKDMSRLKVYGEEWAQARRMTIPQDSAARQLIGAQFDRVTQRYQAIGQMMQ